MGILEERWNILGCRMMFFCEVERINGGFEVFRVNLSLGLSDQTRE